MKSLFRRVKPSAATTSTAMSSDRDQPSLVSQGYTPKSDPPIVGNWDSAHTTIGAGVAIFHLASSRVVLCYHPLDKYWFLPKGRRDASEDTGSGAEREGFEEVDSTYHSMPLAG